MTIYLAYISKHNSNNQNQNYSLIDSKRRRVTSLAVKTWSALLSGLISKHNGDFYCLKKNKKKQQTNKTNKLESQKTLCLINTWNWIRHHLLFMQILNLCSKE